MARKNLLIIVVAVVLVGIGAWLVLNTTTKDIADKPDGEITEVDKDVTEVSAELVEVLARAQNVTFLKYDIEITSPVGAMVGEVWQKNGKSRVKMMGEGQEMIGLIDMDEEIVYVYLPAFNVAIKTDLSEVEEVLEASIRDQAASILAFNPVVIGKEMLDGKSCLVIEYIAQEEKTKVWIWEEYGLPVRSETETSYGLVEAQVSNIEFADIPDEMFELPEGVEITEEPFF